MTDGKDHLGRRLASGQLRVDVARAVQKLRDYQLVDPVDWVLEVVRAATFLGAPSIEVEGDADDVWVRWPAALFPEAGVVRLFDHLIHGTASADPAERALRWLAIGVNAALGLAPRSVDVTWRESTSDTTARRVRFTPGLFDTSSDEEGHDVAEALTQLEVTACAVPSALPGRGVEVHFRRTRGWKAFTLFALGREPDELARVARACVYPRTTIRVAGAELGPAAPPELMRTPLSAPHRGFVALVDPAERPPTCLGIEMHIAEVGVELARVLVAPAFACTNPLPIAAVIDHDRLPTNASRSAVQDAALQSMRTAVEQATTRLVHALARDLARSIAKGEVDAALRRAALTILAANRAGEHLYPFSANGNRTDASLAPLAELRLLRDATGAPRSLAELSAKTPAPGIVERGPATFPSEVTPWLGHLPWIPPGDDAEVLLAGFVPASADGLAQHASRALAAWQKWSESPVAPPKVEAKPEELARVRLEGVARLEGIALAPGLEGELVLLERGGATVEVRIDGRRIERTTSASSVPFEAAVSWPPLRPDGLYTQVRRDEAWEALSNHLDTALVRAAEVYLTAHAGRPSGALSESRRALLRHVLYRGGTLGLGPALLESGPLRDAPLFPIATEDGSAAFATLRELAAQARRDVGAVYVALDPAFVPPRGRAIVRVDHAEASALVALLPFEAHLVDYDGAEGRVGPVDAGSLARDLAKHSGYAAAFEEDTRRVAACFAEAGHMESCHVGILIDERRFEHAPVALYIVVDDDAIVPAPDWEGGKPIRRPTPKRVVAMLDRLTRACVVHLTPDALPASDPIDAHPETTVVVDWGGLTRASTLAAMVCHLAARGVATVLSPGEVERLRHAPLFVTASGRRVSANDLQVRYPADRGKLPYLKAAAHDASAADDLDPDELDPVVVATREHRLAVEALLERPLRDASGVIAKRRQEREHERRLLAHRRHPVAPLEIDSPYPTWVLDGDVRGVVAVSPRLPAGAELTVMVEQRIVLTTEPPSAEVPSVVARLDIPARYVDPTLRQLTPHGESRTFDAVRASVGPLLGEIARSCPEWLSDDRLVWRLLREWLRTNPSTDPDLATLALLRTTPMFPSVRGPRIATDDARAGTMLRIGSYQGEWLEPAPGSAPSAIDLPILSVPPQSIERSRRRVYHTLSGCTSTTDLSRQIAQVQTARRIDRGLQPRPTLRASDPGVTRDIESLVSGALLLSFGPGQVALGRDRDTMCLLHRHGEHVETLEIAEIEPSLVVALEAPPLVDHATTAALRAKLEPSLERLGALLVRELAPTAASLPGWARRRVRRALLTSSGAEPLLETAAVFDTTDGRWLTLAEVRAAPTSPPVWATVLEDDTRTPLDPERFALRLSVLELATLRSTLLIVDATTELALDLEAKTNRAAPPIDVRWLEGPGGPLPPLRAFGLVRVDEDGRFGWVSPLLPDGGPGALTLVREGVPLGSLDDPCDWPTHAIIDCAALTPNRTWSAPEENEVLAAVRALVRDCSEGALARAIEDGESYRVGLRDAMDGEPPVCGVLSLTPFGQSPRCERIGSDGISHAPLRPKSFRPSSSERSSSRAMIPVNGRLWVAASVDHPAVAAIASRACATMLRQLAVRTPHRDEERAQLVHGLALGLVDGNDLAGLHLDGLAGAPIVGSALEEVVCGERAVALVAAEHAHAFAEHRTQEGASAGAPLAVIDDGSLTARALREAVGDRARPWPQHASVSTSDRSTPWSNTSSPGMGASSEVSAAAGAADHPLVEALEDRLAKAGVRAMIFLTPGETFFARPKLTGLTLGEARPAWMAVAAALEAGDPRADAALDLLALGVAGAIAREQGTREAPDYDISVGLLER